MYLIGVYGSAEATTPETTSKAREIGESIAHRGGTVITGACSGLPYAAAQAAAALGGTVEGYSPVQSLEQQRLFVPDDDPATYTRLHFLPQELTGSGLDVAKKYRNVASTSRCDGGIIISGKWGTLHEFCSLADFGAIIGVLTGTGGIADALPSLVERIGSRSRMNIVFDDEPSNLVARVWTALQQCSA